MKDIKDFHRKSRRRRASATLGLAALGMAGFAPAQVTGPAIIHGINQQIKSLADLSYCIDTDDATSITPSLYLAVCTGRGSQRWTFTDGADGTSVIVSDLGLCLSVETGPTPHRLGVAPCTYHSDQRFGVSPVGMLVPKFTDHCATIAVPPVAGELVYIEDCAGPTSRSQIWRFIP